MKKKVISAFLSAIMLIGSAAVASADISVSVDRRTVVFPDQEPIAENNRVLVPVRGVFEALGAKVLWNGENQSVTIFAKDNMSRLILYIDSNTFKQVTFKSILSYEVTELTSEVAPKIVNGRTMIPIYLIADYMGNEALWSGEEQHIYVTSKERLKLLSSITPEENMTAEEALNATLPNISISVDKTEVNAGDEVKVSVNISNTSVLENTKYFGTTGTVYYDRENFEFKSCNYLIDSENSAKAHNPDYFGDSVKYIFLHDPNILPDIKDGAVVEMVFVAKNDNGGTFKLSDRVVETGADTSLTVYSENGDVILDSADELYIDTTAVVVK